MWSVRDGSCLSVFQTNNWSNSPILQSAPRASGAAVLRLDGQIVKIDAIDGFSLFKVDQGMVGMFLIDPSKESIVENQLPTSNVKACWGRNFNKFIHVGSSVVVVELRIKKQ